MRSTSPIPNPTSRVAAITTIAILICAMGCSARQPIVQRDDVSITNDVRARLAADAQASPSEIAVDTKAGIVHLTGTVATNDERDSVERIARDAPGVHAVNNDVRFGDVPVRVKSTSH
jgi:hypothetical protein